MGLACLSAHLAENGVAVGVMDANIRLYNDAGGDMETWWSMDSKARWVYPSAIEQTWQTFAPQFDAYIADLAAAKAPVELVQIAGQSRLQSENRVSIHAYGLLAANVATTDQQITG